MINSRMQWNIGEEKSCHNVRDCSRLRVIHRKRHWRWNWRADCYRDGHLMDYVSWMMRDVVLLPKLTLWTRLITGDGTPLLVSLNQCISVGYMPSNYLVGDLIFTDRSSYPQKKCPWDWKSTAIYTLLNKGCFGNWSLAIGHAKPTAMICFGVTSKQ